MSGRTGRNQAPPPSSNRQNEYFVPRDGIDREVITADICRYLGNDALVRPGVYESPQTGQVVQGYFITAYRNLTTAMIEYLKADSARWDQERRQQTARNPVGVQYRNSDTHQSRQYYGPTEGSTAAAYPDSSRDSYDANPRYPGTGSAGYTGATSGYTAQGYTAQGGYGGQTGYGSAQPQQFSPSAADSYPGGAPMAGTAFGQTVAERPYAQPVNMTVRPGSDTAMYGAGDPYQTGARDRVPASSVAQGRPTYVTAGSATQQGYPSNTAGGYYQPQNPTTAQFAAVQPQDPFYGRGNPSYGATHDPQYETTPPPRTSATASSTQMATSGTSSRRDRERDRDNRDSVDRSHTDSRQRHHRR